MTPTQTPTKPTSSTLYFGPWYRRSPFFEKTLAAGASAYDIYNHMYLPGYYADPVEEYWALLNDVTVWDVSVERIVEITGPDSSEFINRLTCRDLTKCAVGQAKYVLITAEDGTRYTFAAAEASVDLRSETDTGPRLALDVARSFQRFARLADRQADEIRRLATAPEQTVRVPMMDFESDQIQAMMDMGSVLWGRDVVARPTTARRRTSGGLS